MPTRVLLADDHNLVRQGLSLLLAQKGFCIAAEAADGLEAVRLTKELQPDVAILDIGMQPVNGIDAAREIHRDVPGIRIILLTMHSDDNYVVEAFQAGATGYVVKSEAGASLASAITDVCAGSTYLSPKVSRTTMETYLHRGRLTDNPLTLREKTVMSFPSTSVWDIWIPKKGCC